MKRCWLLVPLFILIICSPVFSSVDSNARFSNLSGQVKIRPDVDEDAWSLAKLSSVLNVMDHIQTAQDSSAIISFADLTTFVMKPNGEIILNTGPEKESKVKLLAGNVWVNVKKMIKDGTMEIEMNQAVAGIKGTNITCQTDKLSMEDRIQVLRGEADILIKESQEHITLKEGEELIVKKGVKPEKIGFDVDAAKESWKEITSKMGENIEMNEIPDVLQKIGESETEIFKALQDTFKTLLSAGSVSEETAQAFKKDAERFIGVLMEDQLIIQSMQLKIDKAHAAGVAPDQMSQITSYLKMVGAARVKNQSFQGELAKMLKANFNKNVVSEGVEKVQNQVAEIKESVDAVLREIEAQPTGLSQDWFKDAVSKCSDTLTKLERVVEDLNALLEANPNDQLAKELLKQASNLQQQIANMMKDFSIVEIEASTLTQMQDIDDSLSGAISQLRVEIDKYNTTVQGGDAEKRLRSSLQILSDFSKSRRLYINAQRLFDSIIKTTSGQKFKTAEQEELESKYERITDTYQTLGIVAGELESRLNELESQLGTLLK